MESNCPVRVYRDDVLIHSGQLNSLRRFKDDVATVQSGQECGFRLENYNDLRTGDLIEAVNRYEEAPTLERSGRA
jgi:translation initiation factor IF-2